MCGRYKIEPVADGWTSLAELLTGEDLTALREIEPRRNITPGSLIPVVRWAHGEPAPKLVQMLWGLVPPWWKQDKPPTETKNARCESAPEKPMWRDAVKYRRCLIPATAWYEWTPVIDAETGEVVPHPKRKGEPLKKPQELISVDQPTICFAGLWARAVFRGAEIESAAIVTRASVPPLDRIHDRMPVIVPPDRYREWLDPSVIDVGLFREISEAPPPANFQILDQGPA